jgi:hypothetical protein
MSSSNVIVSIKDQQYTEQPSTKNEPCKKVCKTARIWVLIMWEGFCPGFFIVITRMGIPMIGLGLIILIIYMILALIRYFA